MPDGCRARARARGGMRASPASRLRVPNQMFWRRIGGGHSDRTGGNRESLVGEDMRRRLSLPLSRDPDHIVEKI